jgi:hypothetical protein
MDFKITGLDEVIRKLDGIAKAADPNTIASQFRAYRCPVHGKAPTNIRIVGDQVKAGFCCAVARDGAAKATTDSIKRSLR